MEKPVLSSDNKAKMKELLSYGLSSKSREFKYLFRREAKDKTKEDEKNSSLL